MNCFNEQLIQTYIDGETSATQNNAIEMHLANCNTCSLKLKEQKELVNLFMKNMNTGIQSNPTIPILKLPEPKIKSKYPKTKEIIYSLSAACILAFVFLITKQPKSIQQENIIYQSFEFEYDANKTIIDQELIINIVDPEGNVNQYYLD